MEENRLRDEMPDREAKGAPAESSVRVEARECAASRESGSEPASEPAVSFPCGRAGVEAMCYHHACCVRQIQNGVSNLIGSHLIKSLVFGKHQRNSSS